MQSHQQDKENLILKGNLINSRRILPISNDKIYLSNLICKMKRSTAIGGIEISRRKLVKMSL